MCLRTAVTGYEKLKMCKNNGTLTRMNTDSLLTMIIMHIRPRCRFCCCRYLYCYSDAVAQKRRRQVVSTFSPNSDVFTNYFVYTQQKFALIKRSLWILSKLQRLVSCCSFGRCSFWKLIFHKIV